MIIWFNLMSNAQDRKAQRFQVFTLSAQKFGLSKDNHAQWFTAKPLSSSAKKILREKLQGHHNRPISPVELSLTQALEVLENLGVVTSSAEFTNEGELVSLKTSKGKQLIKR